MTAEETSARLGIPADECGADSCHAIVNAIQLIELGHIIVVTGSADPKNRQLKTTAETVDVLIALYRLNPSYEFFLACKPHTGLVALEWKRGKDRLFLQNNFGNLPQNSWRIDLPTRERAFEIYAWMPGEEEYRTDVWIENVRARIRYTVPVQGSIDPKSGEPYRWSPGRSPWEVPITRLPSGWREGLPIVRKRAYA